MNYRRKLRELARHRNRCLSMIPHLMDLHENYDGKPVALKNLDVMTCVLELLDLGYLDPDAFPVGKSGGTVTSLHYNGRFPLSGEGGSRYEQHLLLQRQNHLQRVIVFTVLLVLIIVFFIVISSRNIP